MKLRSVTVGAVFWVFASATSSFGQGDTMMCGDFSALMNSIMSSHLHQIESEDELVRRGRRALISAIEELKKIDRKAAVKMLSVLPNPIVHDRDNNIIGPACSFAFRLAAMEKIPSSNVFRAFLEAFLSDLDPHSRLVVNGADAGGCDPPIPAGGVPNVEIADIAPGIRYIRIRSFAFEAEKPIRDSWSADPEPRAIVLDLRDNLGGEVEKAVRVADLFLSGGVITSIWKREKGSAGFHPRPEILRSACDTLSDAPMVILVNENTASASELLAQSFSTPEHGRAVIVGRPTVGKGSVQNTYRTDPDGPSRMYLTDGAYYSPRGRSLQRRTVALDIEIPSCSPGEFVVLPESLRKKALETFPPLGPKESEILKPTPSRNPLFLALRRSDRKNFRIRCSDPDPELGVAVRVAQTLAERCDSYQWRSCLETPADPPSQRAFASPAEK